MKAKISYSTVPPPSDQRHLTESELEQVASKGFYADCVLSFLRPDGKKWNIAGVNKSEVQLTASARKIYGAIEVLEYKQGVASRPSF